MLGGGGRRGEGVLGRGVIIRRREGTAVYMTGFTGRRPSKSKHVDMAVVGSSRRRISSSRLWEGGGGWGRVVDLGLGEVVGVGGGLGKGVIGGAGWGG